MKLAPLVGDQMETILQIIEECLIGLAPAVDMDCWHAHLDMVTLLRRPSFTESDLEELQLAIDKFKRCFYQAHAHVSERFTTRKDGITKRHVKPLNLQFPNFGALEHWPHHVSSPQKCGSTATLTASCSFNTNQKEFERDVMLRVRGLLSSM